MRNKITKKTKKGISLFGINDCHRPKKNTKKSYQAAFHKRVTFVKGTQVGTSIRDIILFPHHLGQSRGGVEKAPGYLAKFIDPRTHRFHMVKNTGSLYKNINDLYRANEKVQGVRINIGGDHSMTIATLAHTLNHYPEAKVLYFDAHADINTYAASNSKHYHGMPLSFLTGLDPDKKRHFPFVENQLPFVHLLYMGSRCWDIFERNVVHEKNIHFIEPAEFNRNPGQTTQKILDWIGDAPLHISFDVDSMDPKFIPSTGTPVKGGLDMEKTIKLLDKLRGTKRLVNMDITELNMDLGSKADGKKSGYQTAHLFSHFLS